MIKFLRETIQRSQQPPKEKQISATAVNLRPALKPTFGQCITNRLLVLVDCSFCLGKNSGRFCAALLFTTWPNV